MKKTVVLLFGFLLLMGSIAQAQPPWSSTPGLPTNCSDSQVIGWNSTTRQWTRCLDSSGSGVPYSGATGDVTLGVHGLTAGSLSIGATGLFTGHGSPEGVKTATYNSVYYDLDAYPGVYIKSTNTGNTGWVLESNVTVGNSKMVCTTSSGIPVACVGTETNPFGSGAGTILGSLAATANLIPKSTGTANTIGLSGVSIDSSNNLTGATAITASGAITSSQATSTAGTVELYASESTPSGKYIGWEGPSSAPSSSLLFQLSATAPSAGQTMVFGTPAAGVSAQTWATPLTTGANAFTGAQTFTGSGGLTSPPITTDIRAATAGGATLGTTALPFSNLIFSGASGTPATNQFKITGTSTGGVRTLTLADGNTTLVAGTMATTGANAFTGAQTFTGSGGLTSPPITTDIRAATAGGATLGTTALPFSNLFFSGASGTPATNQFEITGTSTGGVRTLTLADGNTTLVAGTMAITNAANTFTGHQTIEGVTSTGATGAGKFVFDGTPTLTTPVIGAATGTSLIVTGRISGTVGMVISTAGSATSISSTNNASSYYMNTGDSAAHSVYTLPTAAAGLQYCVRNYTGITQKVKLITSAAGQYIDNSGTLTATGGYVISAGAAGDSACVIGVDGTHWSLFVGKGTWTNDN